jgi:hypothetical protein
MNALIALLRKILSVFFKTDLGIHLAHLICLNTEN